MKYEDIGKKIRYYRNGKKLTQQQLADKIGVTWEMVSRYERGKSSPFMKFDQISQALELDPQLLVSNSVDQRETPNHIPLFTSIPTESDFSSKYTKYSYCAPDWVIKLDRDCFAIETHLVKLDTLKIRDNGILYICPSYPRNEINVFLCSVNNELICSDTPKGSVIGGVVAQEIRTI